MVALLLIAGCYATTRYRIPPASRDREQGKACIATCRSAHPTTDPASDACIAACPGVEVDRGTTCTGSPTTECEVHRRLDAGSTLIVVAAGALFLVGAIVLVATQ